MPDRKPILIASYTGVLGGSERILLDLLRHRSMDVVLACPPGPLADAAAAADVPVLRIAERPLEARSGLAPAIAGGHLVAHGREVASIAESTDPAAVVAWGMRPAMAMSAVRRLPGIGRSIDDIPVIAEHVDLLPPGPQGRMARRALLACDGVICLSRAIASDLTDNASGTGTVRVVHPAVETPTTPTVTRTEEAQALILAAIEPWKGHEIALEAIAMTPGVHLTVAGSPLSRRGEELLARLKDRAARADLDGRVSFVGTVDPHRALADSDFLIHPAPSEPFGMAMAEALAAGRPVIASAACGALEIVDGSCGRLVTPNDAAAFAKAIEELRRDPDLVNDLGEQGRRKAAIDFDAGARRADWWRTIESSVDRASASKDRPTVAEATTRRPLTGGDLSIVTVIHDSAPDLARLLESITRFAPDAQVIVVDSGSADSGPAIAGQWHGGARVISLEGNLGFGAGCVAGMELAERPVTALINPDVELIDPSIAALAAELADPAAPDRLLSPALIHPDGRRQDAVHPRPAETAEWLRASIPASMLPKRLSIQAEPHRSRRPIEVGWAVAACLLGRTGSLRRLGPFDTSVHLYAEDLDLCLRAFDEGIPTWYRPDARVIHREAHSSSVVFGGEPSLLLAERRREVIGTRLGADARRTDDRIQLLTNLNRLVIKTLIRRDTTLERARIAALRQARRGTA